MSSSHDGASERPPPSDLPDWASNIDDQAKCYNCTMMKPIWQYMSKRDGQTRVKTYLDCRDNSKDRKRIQQRESAASTSALPRRRDATPPRPPGPPHYIPILPRLGWQHIQVPGFVPITSSTHRFSTQHTKRPHPKNGTTTGCRSTSTGNGTRSPTTFSSARRLSRASRRRVSSLPFHGVSHPTISRRGSSASIRSVATRGSLNDRRQSAILDAAQPSRQSPQRWQSGRRLKETDAKLLEYRCVFNAKMIKYYTGANRIWGSSSYALVYDDRQKHPGSYGDVLVDHDPSWQLPDDGDVMKDPRLNDYILVGDNDVVDEEIADEELHTVLAMDRSQVRGTQDYPSHSFQTP
ncbi:uncharacterized protein F4822DRAFT_432901 [Hypoxylon trugodes]|uniref:uncharacterized protein n=1 Tax=Hypoxylon trugodes TaxID=326681 RepID=UPI0021A22B31|nr:uncharacterized protein F4822DRAFT_432901 [Hypoxylon trugodes]KAI1384355.1 hypothetical protein F4822DRAFT_432901 [Hypoxylon trugodes]